MQTVSGNPRPDLLTYLIEMSFVLTAPARRNSTVLFKRPTPGIIFAIAIKPARLRLLLARRRGAESTAPATRDHIQTSKSGPIRPSVFNTFDFQMCFKPQRHAIVDPLMPPDGSAPAAFASLLFYPPEPKNFGRTQCCVTFLSFPAF